MTTLSYNDAYAALQAAEARVDAALELYADRKHFAVVCALEDAAEAEAALVSAFANKYL